MKFFLAASALFITQTARGQTTFTIYFELDRHELTTEARSRLDSFITTEKNALHSYSFSMDGHCDASGSTVYNNSLSRKRVNRVRAYLISGGVPSTNFSSVKAFGEDQPLYSNDNEVDRRFNRRVAIRFIKTNESAVTTIKEQIADSAVKTGSNIVLRHINFVGGMDDFLPESSSSLDELLEAMKTYPLLVIRIEGHICCQSGPNDGIDLDTGLPNLSEARAKAVHDWLIAKGVQANRVSYKGFGHSNPLYPFPETTEEEKILNRRVEIKILKK